MKPLITSSIIAGVMLVNLAARAAFPEQITGTVLDTNGAPAVGLEVKTFPGVAESNARTDANGRFQLKLRNLNRPRNITPLLLVRDVNRNLAVDHIIEDGTESYKLQLAPGVTLSGRLQDEQGKPITNGVVTAYVRNGNVSWGVQNSDATKFDTQGRFEVNALPPGRRYYVSASAKGYGSSSSSDQEPEGNRIEVPPLTLDAADQKVAGIVVDLDEKPVKGATVSIRGQGQPNNFVQTDAKGRFAIEACEGVVNISAFLPSGSGRLTEARTEAGDTNVILTLGSPQQRASQLPTSQPQRASLVGKPLPDLTAVGLSGNALQTNKPQLICLFDPEQRPSRRLLRLLGEQNETLKQKGITVVGISATLTTPDALKAWKESNPLPFAVGGVTERADKTQWILNTGKLPWLILTDAQGRATAEGFNFEDLDAKLK